MTTTPPPATPTKPNAPPVTLTQGTASPDPAVPLPTVKFLAPMRDQLIPVDKASDFAVKLDVKNWQTAKGSSHVHLILDNKPYKALYDTKAPVKLSELTAGESLGEGMHMLVAFPSRANHESVKTKDALVMVPFWVGKKDPAAAKADATKKAMLVYSRPKGEYNGEMANHVLVDFQVANVALAEGKTHAHVSVTGPGIEGSVEGKVEKVGTPLYLDNLQNGSYTVKVELMDGANKSIEGAWNSTTRTIKIDHDAPMDMSMSMPSSGPDGGASTGPTIKDAGAAPKK